MRWIEVSQYGEKRFVRLIGAKRTVFEQMVEVVGQSQRAFKRPLGVYAS